MRFSLYFLILIFAQKGFSCGGGYYSEELYYQLFDQRGMVKEQYYPFLNINDYILSDNT